jgi:hypothetical protein
MVSMGKSKSESLTQDSLVQGSPTAWITSYAYCKSLLIKASAECPKCNCKCKGINQELGWLVVLFLCYWEGSPNNMMVMITHTLHLNTHWELGSSTYQRVQLVRLWALCTFKPPWCTYREIFMQMWQGFKGKTLLSITYIVLALRLSYSDGTVFV